MLDDVVVEELVNELTFLALARQLLKQFSGLRLLQRLAKFATHKTILLAEETTIFMIRILTYVTTLYILMRLKDTNDLYFSGTATHPQIRFCEA